MAPTQVTLQTLGCIAVFGPAFWSVLLSVLPDVALPVSVPLLGGPLAGACNAVGAMAADGTCSLQPFLTGGRSKAMFKFSLQQRVRPAELLAKAGALDETALHDAYCEVTMAADG